MVHQDRREVPDRQAQAVHQDRREVPDLQVPLEALEPVDHQDHQEVQDPVEALDLQDLLDHPDQQVRQEFQVQAVPRVRQEALDLQDHLVFQWCLRAHTQPVRHTQLMM